MGSTASTAAPNAVPKTLKSRKGLPPGPRMPVFLQHAEFWFRRLEFLEACRAKYGHRFTLRMRIPATPFVVLSDPTDVRELFLAPPDVLYAGDGSSELQKYFGPTGLAFMEEDEHLAQRKVVNRSVHGPAVARIAQSVAAVSARNIATWPRDEVAPLYWPIFRMTLEVMRHVSFGPEPDERLDRLIDVVDDMMHYNFRPSSMLELQELSPRTVDFIRSLRPIGLRRFMALREQADALIYEVVEDRRRSGGESLDMVGMLLASEREDGSEVPARQVRDEVMTTFLAGTATTAATIAWGLAFLSREDDARERLVAEIDAGEDDAYLTATVQEILRRRPPLPGIIPRHVQRPIEIGGVEYPTGTRLWPSAYLAHHNPEVYEDPYAFCPERFLDQGPGTYTWIPFGGGRRRCLGTRVAELEIKTVLAALLRQFDVRPERAKPERASSHIVTIYPSRGARVALSER